MVRKLGKHILVVCALYLTFSTLISGIEVINAEKENKEESFNVDSLFFDEPWMRTEVDKVIEVRVKSETTIREVVLTLPPQAQFMDEGLVPEVEFIDIGENRWKFIPSSEVGTLRVPVVFKESGTYEIRMGTEEEVVVDMGVIVDPAVEKQLENETNLMEQGEEIDGNIDTDKFEASAAISPLIQRLALEERTVTNWAEFRAAVADQTVKKISLANNITRGTGTVVNTVSITRGIEIDGGGYTLSLGADSISVNAPLSADDNVLHMHNITVENASGQEEFVGSRGAPAITAQWEFRFGNITVPRGTTQRLARAYSSKVTMYGINSVDTRAENFYLGSMIFEPDTVYFGNINFFDYSVIWFERIPVATGTGSAAEFVLEDSANVRLGSTTNNATYPGVYHNYNRIIVGENAKYSVSLPGNAVRFDRAGSSLLAKKGSVVNLTSLRSSGYATINHNAANTDFTVEEGGSLYVIANSATSAIDLSGAGARSFVLNSPAAYDIRNSGSGLALNLGATSSVAITETDIDLWNVGIPVLGASTFSYASVGSLSASGLPATQSVVSSNTNLQENFRTNRFRRIAGMNTAPEVFFISPFGDDLIVTDADLSVKTRVKIGLTPDDSGFDVDGNFFYIPVWAALGQAEASLESNDGSIGYDALLTNKEGFVVHEFTEFLQAGTLLSASADRGGHISEIPSEIQVIDVTPPPPAIVVTDLTVYTTRIQGLGGEPGAIVTYTINGIEAEDLNGTILSTLVEEDGTWELDIPPAPFQLSDRVQIFLTDSHGNKNPTENLHFRDADFSAATSVLVSEPLSPPVPVDPLDPDTEIVPENPPVLPENQGRLSIDFISQFDFGEASISVEQREYNALPQRLLDEAGNVNVNEERPNYIQISDRRISSERGAWGLSAALNNSSFQNEANDELKGAELVLKNQQLATSQTNLGNGPVIIQENEAILKPGIGVKLLATEEGEGRGTWIYRFGDSGTAGASVLLDVPSGANPTVGNYRATITWELSLTPGN